MNEEKNYLDLRSIPCPLNVVKCNLALEKLSSSDPLLVDLDLGEPEEMVKNSVKKNGFKCKTIKKGKNFIRYSISHEYS